MHKIGVYYNDVLRYTVMGNLDKVQELRNEGYAVQIMDTSGQELRVGGWHSSRSFSTLTGNDLDERHNDKLAVRQFVEVPSDIDQLAFGFH